MATRSRQATSAPLESPASRRGRTGTSTNRARSTARSAPMTPPPPEERSLGELFSEMTQQLQVLVRKELELARVETKDQVAAAGRTGAMFGAAGVVALVGVLLLAMAMAWGLAEVMPAGLAFLIVAVVFVLVAVAMFESAKSRARSIRPVPVQTLETVKSDVDVAKAAIQRGVQTDESQQSTAWQSYGHTEITEGASS